MIKALKYTSKFTSGGKMVWCYLNSKVLLIFLFFFYTSPIVCHQVNMRDHQWTVDIDRDPDRRGNWPLLLTAGLRASLARGDAGTPPGFAFSAICTFCAFSAFCALCAFCTMAIGARALVPPNVHTLTNVAEICPPAMKNWSIDHWGSCLGHKLKFDVEVLSLLNMAVCLANFPLSLIL